MEQKNGTNKALIIICIVLTVVVLALIGLLLLRKPASMQDIPAETAVLTETGPATEPVMTEIQMEEAGLNAEVDEDIARVTTPYGVVEYPYAFSDVIYVALEDNTLEFWGEIGGGRVLLYTVKFTDSEGLPVYSDTVTDKSTISFHVEFSEAPLDWLGSNLDTFYAAQETANDVMTVLSEAEGYSMK